MQRAWPALVLAVLTLAVFAPVVFLGKGLSADGSLVQTQPWSDTELAADPPPSNLLLGDQYHFFNANEEFISRWVRRGVWPLWNPDLAHGIPTIASIQNAEYFPTNLLFWPFPPFWTRGIRTILRVAMCLAGTFLFGRAVGLERGGATLAAMAFTYCGFNVVWLGHPPTNVSFVLPVMLWTLERFLQTGAWRWGAGLSLAAGAALLGGHPPQTFHISIIAFIWLGWRLFIRRNDPVPRLTLSKLAPRLVAVALTAALIGSAAVLPWSDYLAQNPGQVASLRQGRTLSWQTLSVWVVPDFFGNPSEKTWFYAVYKLPGWNNYAERTGYVGVVGLLLVGLGLQSRRQLLSPWPWGLAFSAILIYDPPFFGPLARGLPLFRDVNNSKMLCVACFCAAMLAGFGIDRLLESRARLVRTSVSLAVVALIAGIVLFAAWPDAAGREWIEAIGMHGRLLQATLWPLVPLLALAGAVVLVGRERPRIALALLLAVSAVDLWRFATGFNPTISPSAAAPATDGIRFLKEHVNQARILPVGSRLLLGNTMLRFDVPDVRGGDWVNVRHYEYLLTGKSGDYNFGARLWAIPDTAHALNVSHAVFPRGELPAGVPKLYDRELQIVRALGLPRAFLVHEALVVEDDETARRLIAHRLVDLRRTVVLWDSGSVKPLPERSQPVDGETVHITHANPNEVRIAVEARADAYLVLVDTYFPGWQCERDGEPATIHRANVAFRAVRVPPGSHELRFRYRPWRDRAGLVLAGVTVAGLFVVSVVRVVRRRASVRRVR